ncbi:MAG: sulfatase-like hydrolase/transferase [Proteobacteria bacterium]|nr:sulfatase-like hydrolase/transferase [Pseudomonadota bacterium]
MANKTNRTICLHSVPAVAAAAISLAGCALDTTPGHDEPGGDVVAATKQQLATDGTNNILLIIADDIGVDNISGYNEHNDSAYTPKIDSLATSGVLFRNAWLNPMCSPSRASVYTGRHAFRHGVLHPSDSELNPAEETIAEVLSDAGYATAMFGKWHLGETSGYQPTDQGYNYFSGSLAGNISDYFSWQKDTIDAAAGTSVTVTETSYATRVNQIEARTWISEQTGPWFATIAFNAGHSPFHVPPHELYTGRLSGNVGDACTGSTDSQADCYRAMVESMDTYIGRLLSWLDRQGERDNTLVIFLGDNGTPGNVIIDNGVFSTTHGKSTVYEGGVNVPLIISGAGVDTGVEVSDLVQVLDVFATMREIGNGSSSSGITVDSQSLYDYLTGTTASSPRSSVYSELYGLSGSIDRWSVTNGTAKYLYNEGTEECYDLSNDAGETSNQYDEVDAPIASVCDSLAGQRPCTPSSECPGS